MSGELEIFREPDFRVDAEPGDFEVAPDRDIKVDLEAVALNGRDGTGVIVVKAAIDCGGHKAVRAVAGGIEPASASIASQAGSVVGITTNAALAGEELTVVAVGDIEEPSWAWSLGPVFLAEAGALTQTPPTAGFLQQVGVATSPTHLVVLLSSPIRLT
jgi:hypothetical protein